MALLHDARYRALFYQGLTICIIGLIAWSMFATASHNLERQDIATGFSYLSRQAGFVISETTIAYQPTDSVSRALLVGLANTIKVSVLAAFSEPCWGFLSALAACHAIRFCNG